MGGATIAAIVLGALAILGVAAIIGMRVVCSSGRCGQPPAHPNTAARFQSQMFTFAGGGGGGNYSTPNIPTSAELAARAAAAAAVTAIPAPGAAAWAKQYDALTASTFAVPGQIYAVPAESAGEVVIYAPSSSFSLDAYGGVTYGGMGTGVQYRPIYATSATASRTGDSMAYSSTGVQYRPIYATSVNVSGDGGGITYSAIDSNTATAVSTRTYAQPLSKEERRKPAASHAAQTSAQVPPLPVRRVTKRSGSPPNNSSSSSSSTASGGGEGGGYSSTLC